MLTLARDLRRRRARERQGLFVAEGVRAVEELLRSPLRIHGALASPAIADDPRAETLVSTLRERGVPLQDVDPGEFASAAETDTPQGILAVAGVPERMLASLPDPTPHRLLVLDAVQDPGNVGTILRTSAALGAVGTVALPGTVDLWNAKVVRSAMGAHFHHPALSCTWDELRAFLADRAITLWGADPRGESFEALEADASSPVPARLALAVGNEGSGLSTPVRDRADRLVALPTAAVDSLNVAVATGILLYALRPRR